MTNTVIEAQEQDVVRLNGNVDLEHSPEIRKILLRAVASLKRFWSCDLRRAPTA